VELGKHNRSTEYKKRRILAFKAEIAAQQRTIWEQHNRIEELQTQLKEKDEALFWAKRNR
jgi:hypothetical protein